MKLVVILALLSVADGFSTSTIRTSSSSPKFRRQLSSASSAPSSPTSIATTDGPTPSAQYSSYDPSDAFNKGEPPTLFYEHEDIPHDIVQDLDGNPLTKTYFEKILGFEIEGIVPESDAFRGFMSNACRIHLLLKNGKQRTVFYKRIVFKELPHAWEKFEKDPHKLERDSKSYQVVASFLLSEACKLMTQQAGVCIPKCLDAQLLPDEEYPMESKFTFLFEDFAPTEGWYQQWLLTNKEECLVTLSTFAKIHAYFWFNSKFWNEHKDAANELETGVWESGSYVQPRAQPNQCEIVAAEWSTKRLRFENELKGFEYWDNLGTRLQSVAKECGRLAHPFAYNDDTQKGYMKYRTFTHGDPKQANLLFRRSSNALKVGLIDFQWSGFGLAATDIAHFMTSGVHADMLVDGGEECLLKYYFDELQKYLVEFGAYKDTDDALQNYSYDTFMEQYEIGVLDICRLMIAYTWSRFEFPVEKDDVEGCALTMNKTSYNKSIPTIIWLLNRCDEILKSRGV
jgi:thiamine kinase-like enzyme